MNLNPVEIIIAFFMISYLVYGIITLKKAKEDYNIGLQPMGFRMVGQQIKTLKSRSIVEKELTMINLEEQNLGLSLQVKQLSMKP